MTYRTHIRTPNTRIPIAILAAAAVAGGLSAAPGAAQAAGDKAAPQEATAGDAVDDFVNWAQKQAEALDSKLDLKKSAKGEWTDAKQATKEGLAALGDKIEEFRAMVTDKQKS